MAPVAIALVLATSFCYYMLALALRYALGLALSLQLGWPDRCTMHLTGPTATLGTCVGPIAMMFGLSVG